MSWLNVLRFALIVGKQEVTEVNSIQAWLVGWLPRMAAQAIFYSMIGQLLGSPERLEYLVIGSAIAVGLANIALAVPQSTWDRFDGVYPLLVAAPRGLLLSIVGRTSVRLMSGIATSLVAFLALPPLFGISISWPGALAVVPLAVLTLTGSWFVYLFVGSLANLAPEGRNFIHNIVTMSTMAFGGIAVPVSFWPEVIQLPAHAIPVTHGLLAIRSALAGGDAAVVISHAAAAFIVSLAWLGLAILCMDRMASVGRANGSIEFV